MINHKNGQARRIFFSIFVVTIDNVCYNADNCRFGYILGVFAIFMSPLMFVVIRKEACCGFAGRHRCSTSRMKVKFTETVLRDANQSLMATRLPYEKFKEILGTLDQVGYESLECWGGATFDSCLRYLNEDPWDRLRKIKEHCPNTKLQMLLRGQNLLGYRHYPDDIVRRFVELSIKNGIDVVRIFDALNDLRNLEVSINETLKHKAEAQVAICYTTSPIHNLESYAKLVKDIENMGATSICIKDMGGVMGPGECYDLVKAIREESDLSIHLHTHMTTGLAFMTYLKGIEAGADTIDTAISSFSGGTAQPSTETLAYALTQLGYDVDLERKLKNNDFFKPASASTLPTAQSIRSS